MDFECILSGTLLQVLAQERDSIPEAFIAAESNHATPNAAQHPSGHAWRGRNSPSILGITPEFISIYSISCCETDVCPSWGSPWWDGGRGSRGRAVVMALWKCRNHPEQGASQHCKWDIPLGLIAMIPPSTESTYFFLQPCTFLLYQISWTETVDSLSRTHLVFYFSSCTYSSVIFHKVAKNRKTVCSIHIIMSWSTGHTIVLKFRSYKWP